MTRRSGPRILYALASALGLAALLYPLGRPASGANLSPLVLTAVVAVSLAALVLEAGSRHLGARAVAVLGVLVAVNSALRFAEVLVPGPGGFSPIFPLILLGGYAYGSGFGFLLGTLTMAVSALVTGGVGPWLPYQMVAAGWVGLTAGWLPRRRPSRRVVVSLGAFGALWGLLYGLVLTLWLFPFLEGTLPAAARAGRLHRFLAFYAATSLAWDAFRAAGNFLLLVVAGAPVLEALERFRRRFRFDHRAGLETLAVAGGPGVGPQSHGAPRAPGGPVLPGAPGGATEAALETAPGGSAPGLRGGHHLATGRPARLGSRRAWVAWVTGVAAAASITRNPAALLGLWLAAEAVGSRLPAGARGPAPVPVRRLGVMAIAIATAYGALMIHQGDTVLAVVPQGWPLVGGPITLEGAAAGMAGGAALALLLSAFSAFGQALSTRDMIRLVPSAFESLALVLAIALTYLPTARREASAVAEAQAVRGHRVRGPRDWVPLGMPLLVGALENALALAENLAARGLARSPGATFARRRLVTGATALVAGGLAAGALGAPGDLAAVAVAGGAALGAGAVLAAGRPGPTSYRPQAEGAGSLAVAAAGWAPVAAAIAVPSVRAAVAYTPFPTAALPAVPATLALAVAAVALPALVNPARSPGPGRLRPLPPPAQGQGIPTREGAGARPPAQGARATNRGGEPRRRGAGA
ncbi:MAG: ECF transporter S component, partial [Anaerolineae bacterium]